MTSNYAYITKVIAKIGQQDYKPKVFELAYDIAGH